MHIAKYLEIEYSNYQFYKKTAEKDSTFSFALLIETSKNLKIRALPIEFDKAFLNLELGLRDFSISKKLN
jgi:hypothetical protein